MPKAGQGRFRPAEAGFRVKPGKLKQWLWKHGTLQGRYQQLLQNTAMQCLPHWFFHLSYFVIFCLSPPYDLMCLPYRFVVVLQPSRISSINMSFRYLFPSFPLIQILCYSMFIPYLFHVDVYCVVHRVHRVQSFKVHRHGWSTWSTSRGPEVWKLKRLIRSNAAMASLLC